MSFSADSVVVTGATGQLGTAFRHLGVGGTFLDRDALDLTNPSAVRPVLEGLRPTALINCAAYTDVDGAESDEETARTVNGIAVGAMASAASDLGIPFVTYSTDYVFDGHLGRPYVESDSVSPINAYGRSKAMGEDLALANNENALVIRTSWVVSGTHDNFVSTVLKLTAGESTMRVVNDQHGCPTIADDLARATIELLDIGAAGIVHLSNPPVTTWYGFASAIADAAGRTGAVVPCSTDEFPRPATRPAYGALESGRDDLRGAVGLPSWHESLEGLVEAQLDRLSR